MAEEERPCPQCNFVILRGEDGRFVCPGCGWGADEGDTEAGPRGDA